MLIAGLAIALLVGVVSAAVIQFFGQIKVTTTVSQAVLVDGHSYPYVIEELATVAGGESFCRCHSLQSQTSVPVKLMFETTYSPGLWDDEIIVRYWKAPSITIDGFITEAEWGKFFWFEDHSGFDAWDVYGTPTHATSEGRTFKAYAVADCENLYLAFDVIDDKTDLKGDSLNINFNVGDLNKIDAGDCSLETNWIGVEGKDVMWGVCTGDGWGTRVRTYKTPDATGATFDNGVEIRWEFTDHRMYEVVIPLSVLGVKLGDTVKIAGNIYEGYGSTGSPGLLWNDFKDDLYKTNWEDMTYYIDLAIGAEIPEGQVFTLEPYEHLDFYICYEFAVDIWEGEYIITTTVEPAS
jgi:hypothetical protein